MDILNNFYVINNASASTTEADKKRVRFAKAVLSTAYDTSFPGMSGIYVVVHGFANDGLYYGMAVCSQASLSI